MTQNDAVSGDDVMTTSFNEHASTFELLVRDAAVAIGIVNLYSVSTRLTAQGDESAQNMYAMKS